MSKRAAVRQSYNVIVIGASVAGATVANLLGRAGLSVALIDKATFPRRKPCGEGLSSKGLAALSRLRLWQDRTAPAHQRYEGFLLAAGSQLKSIKDIGGGGITVQRSVLDAHLVNQALALPSVTPFLGDGVREIDHPLSGGSATVRCGEVQLTGDTLVIADGSGSRCAQMIGAHEQRLGASRMGVSATYRGHFLRACSQVLVVAEPEFEIYCTPLAEGRLNVSVLAPYRSGLNLRAVYDDTRLLTRVFAMLGFSGECEDAPLGRAPVGNVRRTSPHPHIFLLGDAQEELDPIGGMGMTRAILSAEATADTIISMQRQPESCLIAKQQLARACGTLSRPLRRSTALSYGVVRGSARYPALLSLAASPFGEMIQRFVIGPGGHSL